MNNISSLKAIDENDLSKKIDSLMLNQLRIYRDKLSLNYSVRENFLKICRETLDCILNKTTPCTVEKPELPSLNLDVITFVSIYHGNKNLGCAYHKGKNYIDTLITSTIRAFSQINQSNNIQFEDLHLELNILFDKKIIKNIDHRIIENELCLGLDSLCIEQKGRISIFKNSVPIRNSYTVKETIEKLIKKLNKSAPKTNDDKIKLIRFKTIEFREDFMSKKNKLGLYDLYRSAPLILQSEISKQNVKNAIDSIHLAFIQFIANDKILYEYHINKKKLNDSKQPEAVLRKILSLWIFTKLCIHKNEDLNRSKYLISKFIDSYYVENKNLGFLKIGKVIDIGTSASLLLAVNETSDSSFHTKKVKQIKTFLRSTFNKKENKFQAIIAPKTINYESELYLPLIAINTFLYHFHQEPDEYILEITEKTFPYYENLFWKKNNSLKMLGWATSAYTKLYFIQKKPKYKKFIFDANDNILKYQIINDPNIDLVGSFSKFGNIKTTAVFTESLIDAYQVALDCCDTKRANLYYQAILLALRFILQMQITKEHKQDDFLIGNFKNTLFDSCARIDNLQHAGHALLKFYQLKFQ